jgi:hypothetical protein
MSKVKTKVNTKIKKEKTKKMETKTEVKAGVDATVVQSVKKPNSVRCSKCGRDKYTRTEVYAARVKKFGSEEKMLKGYVCLECRRVERKKAKEDKQKAKEEKQKAK